MRRFVVSAAAAAMVATVAIQALAEEVLSYEHSTRFSPSDYLLGSKQDRHDKIFDNATVIDLGVDLGIGADCGKVDFTSTLRSTLRNMLDSKYFGDMGKDILAASPMLVACLTSPNWCSILRHSQLSAFFSSEMRLDQCSIIDKYTDSRTEDFYRERQTCVRQHIQAKGGNLEEAIEACQNVWDADLDDWAGGQRGKVGTNELIASSAKWAGFEGQEADSSLDLIKSLVGDTVVSRGNVAVNFGPKNQAATPATHLAKLQRKYQSDVCDDLLAKVRGTDSPDQLNRVLSEAELRKVSGGSDRPLVDRQTIEALAAMPRHERELGCRRLADAMGLTVFTKDLNRSLDILTAAAQNPNLPPHRRAEIEDKRRALKDSVELTLVLHKERSDVLNQVQAQINDTADVYRGRRSHAAASLERAANDREGVRFRLMDCADGLMCEGR